MNTLALIAALFISLAIFITPQESIDKSTLNYTITGCAETSQGTNTKAPIQEDINATIYTINNEIHYTKALNHQCCKKITLEKTINNSTITINEQWTGEGCKCMCYTTINATLTGLKKGNYTINIQNENETITSQNITI